MSNTPKYWSAPAVRAASLPTTSYVAGTVIKGADGRGCQEFSQLIIYGYFDKQGSTSMSLKVEFAKALHYALAYDTQTANFTVGATVRGVTSGTTARIISDVDGGTSGTLIIAGVSGGTGVFIDNEALIDDNGTPGAAKVNGEVDVSSATPSGNTVGDYYWQQEVGESYSAGVTTTVPTTHLFTSASQAAVGAFRLAIPINDRYIRISTIGVGTLTSCVVRVDAQLSTN